MTKTEDPLPLTVVGPSDSRPILDIAELWNYRDLFLTFVWRDIKTRYAQSVLGVGWAIIQPVFSMVLFTIIFGNLAKIDSDGVPYALFSFAAVVPWTYFSNALTEATNSVAGASALLTKVYFPRLIIPTAPILSKLVDLGIALLLLGGMLVAFGVTPGLEALALPLLILLSMASALGLALWLSALAVQYRDVKHAMSFGIQLLMYASPVVYPVSNVPESWQLLYALNPMVGVIEGFRSCLLSTRALPWGLIGMSALSAGVLTATGLVYFRRLERRFADVV